MQGSLHLTCHSVGVCDCELLDCSRDVLEKFQRLLVLTKLVSILGGGAAMEF